MAEAPVDPVLAALRLFCAVLDRNGSIDALDQVIRHFTTRRQMESFLLLVEDELEYRATRRRRRSMAHSNAHRTAMALLRSYLTPAQLGMLNRSGRFVVRGSAGGFYRLVPRNGLVHRVERRATRWVWLFAYCLHDYAEDAPDHRRLPLPDLTLQHMLLLLADEPAFLSTAHSFAAGRVTRNIRYRQLWYEDQLRQAALRQAETPVTENREKIVVCLTDVDETAA